MGVRLPVAAAYNHAMRQRRAATLWTVFAVICVASSVLVMRRPDHLSDLHIYYDAVRHVQAGHPLYEYRAANGGPFTYPPFAALVLWPAGLLPVTVVEAAWLLLTCAAVAALAAAVGHATHAGHRNRPVIVAAIACGLMLSAPAQSNLRFGQISVFIVLLALVDALGLTPARHRGLLIGVAAAIKLTPLLFVVFLLVCGRYRDAARAVAAFGVCAAVGAVVLPAASWSYWTTTMVDTSRIGNLASLGNQSVHGMLLRLGVPADALPILWAGLIAGICGVALLRARGLHRAGRPAQAAVLVGCATVAASPVSWTHHQIWPVLAAMLLIGSGEATRRAAGAALLSAMVFSLGVVLRPVATTQGAQFVFENARTLGTVALCLVGFGGAAVAVGHRGTRTRTGLRVATAAAVAFVVVAVQPLPAGADPTFKAYTPADVANPRYFFACRSDDACARLLADGVLGIGTVAEQTKARVNGVVGVSVARVAYRSAPGGAVREIPLVSAFGQRLFSFRSANLSHGALVAYDAGGVPVATYTGLQPN